MLHGIDTITAMNRELANYCKTAHMEFDCGGSGNINAELAIVSEAPGFREKQTRQPLIGSSGKVLWDILRKDGITRNQVYVSNVVKRMLISLSDDTEQKVKLSKAETEHWRQLLALELAALPNLRWIIALGDVAVHALTGNSGIRKWRGSVIHTEVEGRSVQVLCTYNPAFTLREPRMEIVFRMDCGKIKRMQQGLLHVPDITAHINPTYLEAMNYLDYLRSLRTPIGHDIETMGGETSCVGFAHSPTEGMCINFRTWGENRYSLVQERCLRQQIQRVLGDVHLNFVAQNGMFDAAWMWYKDRIRVHGYSFDTMLAHHTLYPSLPHDLGFITAQYTDYPYYKDERIDWVEKGDIDDHWRYNVKDCCITLRSAVGMRRELVATGLDRFYYEHVQRLQRHLVEMTVLGVKCDSKRRDALAITLGDRLAETKRLCQEAAREATGDRAYEFNPGSPQQLHRLFFDELGLVGRGTKTDAENRERMRKHPRTSESARHCIDAIDEYRKQAKFLSVYVKSGIDTDGRFRCEYRQTGVASAPGRLSSSQTPWGTGLNMQTIPEQGKDQFTIDEGYVATYYDMSQIEARIVAYLADIHVWKHQFEMARLHPGSYDAHCALAADMFGVPYEQVPTVDVDPVTGQRTIRYTSKRCRHGLNYRMAADRLATVTGLPMVDAERAYRLYHRATPQIVVWWNDLADLVRRDRQLTTCLGRRWRLLEKWSEDALTSVVAFEPQSTNGDHTASVIYKAREHRLWPRDARFLTNIHDANIAIHRPKDTEAVVAILRQYAEEPLYINSVKNRLAGRDRPEPLIVPADFKMTHPGEDGVHRWSTLGKLKLAA